MQLEMKELKRPLLAGGKAAAAGAPASPAGPEVSEAAATEASVTISAEESKQRTIHLNGFVSNGNPSVTNKLNNRKYTVLGFVPMVLYQQFRYFFNMFFLLLCVSQFIDAFKVGLLFSYVSPLVFVLVLTMIKEAFDDFRRYQRDKETNGQKYAVYSNGEFKPVSSENLKVGNLVEIHAGQRIPADMVLIYTSDPAESVFIKTDQLDGETDWKLRNPISHTQSLLSKSAKNLDKISGYIKCEGPNKEIYKFKGVFINEMNRANDEPLSLDQTLWASTVLCSSKAIGLVVYVGADTRIAMNISEGRVKTGSMDNELNYLSKLLFFLMLVISVLLQLGSGGNGNFVVQVVKYILLLSSIIPVSLRVNLDFSKIVFTSKINGDKDIEAVARNSQIPEELGRVSFVFSDKTGTLTQNEMQFKRIVGEHYRMTNEDNKRILTIMNKELKSFLAEPPTPVVVTKGKTPGVMDGKLSKIKVIKEYLTALAVCHNVTPVIEEGTRVLQASSPDEVALVKAAEDLGLKLHNRTQKNIELLWEQTKDVMSFDVLKNFPFTSERKRMGIIVRDLKYKRIIFYLKGADFIMKKKVPEAKRGFLSEETDELSREGLRCLVYGAKVLTEEDYEAWSKLWDAACANMGEREKAQNAALDKLEEGVQFLMITGVEDKLQEDCAATIEALKSAGIRVWMLTGDKIETVSCVAISTGLKAANEEFFVLKELTHTEELTAELNRFSATSDGKVLILDGTTLATAFAHNEEFFFKVASEAQCVVACRCSPTQKAEVVEAVKKYQGRTTLSIGDGGNDVPMIRCADVGVGIVGKEGKQAALASDFSITKFKHLKDLLLWHGRNSYKRGAVMAQFVIHRGFIISMMQIYFTIIYDFIQVPIFNGYLMLGYTTIYTMLPVFALIFDEDVDKKTAMEYPILYRSLQKGRELTPKTFLIWIMLSVYQAFAIMMINAVLSDNPFQSFIAITFSSLIFVQLVNSLSEVHNMNAIILGSIGVSFIIYVLSFVFLYSYLDMAKFSIGFFIKAAVIGFICYFPIALLKRIAQKMDPSDESRIMRNASLKRKGKIRKIIERYLFCEKHDVSMKDFN